MSFASLLALSNFFETMAMASEWVKGNFDNRCLGVAAALMVDVDLDGRLNDMATAMTEYLRYGPNTLLARGVTIHSESYVSIRWSYFIVPIVTESCQHEKRLRLLQSTEKDVNDIQADAEKAGVRLL
ncbi:hypothetical protein BJY00DRAFT_314297 [Aspergillus carlsbadensis]|nr:hypothetical protein BJY00DRAFT_314297 [Aspergillus carlsbadensis]